MLANHPAERGVSQHDREAHIFLGCDGQRLDYSNWRSRVWILATEDAGLAALRFHDLRHTAGTALLDEGINIKIAQARLGHANPRTTLAVYAQATDEGDREAANRLGERFKPRGSGLSGGATRR